MKIAEFIRNLGPGLLYAGAAIGVSHLVQSTRAGASYGFDLWWVIIMANVIKYPFFEFAPRYATSTGKTLIEGYKDIGNWALLLFALLTIFTMFAVTAAISMVTAGLLGNLIGLNIDIQWLTLIIMTVTMLFLVVGQFKFLDRIMKYIILALTLTTIIAVFQSFKFPLSGNVHFDWGQAVDIAFVIALVGWMPAPFDLSVWYTTWSVAKQKDSKEKITMKMALKDFNVGYIGTAILAIGFLSLGAFIMYGSGQEFSEQGVAFSSQLINMYTESIGSWAYYIIGIAALTTMLSTSITVTDAYPRVLPPTFSLLFNRNKSNLTPKKSSNFDFSYTLLMVLLVAGSWILIVWFGKSMRFMVDLATTISFVTAPLLAILNLWAVMSIKPEDRPKPWLQIFAWISLVFLILFSVFFLIWRFF